MAMTKIGRKGSIQNQGTDSMTLKVSETYDSQPAGFPFHKERSTTFSNKQIQKVVEKTSHGTTSNCAAEPLFPFQ
jgi:hypothetical protein